MKTLLIIMITLLTLSGCGNNASSQNESSTTPPQPHGIADDIKPPASPDI